MPVGRAELAEPEVPAVETGLVPEEGPVVMLMVSLVSLVVLVVLVVAVVFDKVCDAPVARLVLAEVFVILLVIALGDVAANNALLELPHTTTGKVVAAVITLPEGVAVPTVA